MYPDYWVMKRKEQKDMPPSSLAFLSFSLASSSACWAAWLLDWSPDGRVSDAFSSTAHARSTYAFTLLFKGDNGLPRNPPAVTEERLSGKLKFYSLINYVDYL
ncbi:hypothetical protein AVEN_98384-1 [Araneus ventricosus]|uniref:Uncharacterized protein n=1 Tax=Araneus ventricosus TaxID=182803 RepID=A0A4Y2KMW3_ARAVE|nr:hypothetical protein AVEN_98384-1 [Araneus ventricosus]